ncbi:MAG: hypothetical protein QNJ46_11385 [Leptolyngbyaceae cyanobacterium MO_188.B28]|nr:hypothetical protein [Leptolyngbyaceae cyanobacterium MO_188.B28]
MNHQILDLFLLHRESPHPRQQIAVRLWSGVSASEAKVNLWRRRHELKQRLPDSDRWLRVESKTIQYLDGSLKPKQSTVQSAPYKTLPKALGY